MLNINEAVEIYIRGYNNTLTNPQRIVVEAYIEAVLEEEHNHSFSKINQLTDLFEEILNII